jgi:hypothetical protein
MITLAAWAAIEYMLVHTETDVPEGIAGFILLLVAVAFLQDIAYLVDKFRS